MLNRDEKRALLETARAALESELGGGPPVRPPPLPKESPIFENRGAFVTLERGEDLRGCIGFVDSRLPLWETVAQAAAGAATRDPRFPRVTADELPHIRIEISALSPPIPVQAPSDIEIGRDGLIVEKGGRRGLLLPQVAPEWGFGPVEFLEATCEKAGLPQDAWKKPGTALFRFEAEVFHQ